MRSKYTLDSTNWTKDTADEVSNLNQALKNYFNFLKGFVDISPTNLVL